MRHAIRANGTKVELSEGDPVFQGDILQSGAGGSLGIVLADETTFSMAENGRMVLDEMVYDPSTQEGSISMSVLQGVFTFVSGQVAKVDPDAMALKTPVATIGIRGTIVGGEVGARGETFVVLLGPGARQRIGRRRRRDGGMDKGGAEEDDGGRNPGTQHEPPGSF